MSLVLGKLYNKKNGRKLQRQFKKKDENLLMETLFEGSQNLKIIQTEEMYQEE